MKNTIKLTPIQIKRALEFIKESQTSSYMENVKLLHNPMKPDALYVQYLSYDKDGSDWVSSIEFRCIEKDGLTVDCMNGLSELNQLTLISLMEEVEMDEKGNLTF